MSVCSVRFIVRGRAKFRFLPAAVSQILFLAAPPKSLKVHSPKSTNFTISQKMVESSVDLRFAGGLYPVRCRTDECFFTRPESQAVCFFTLPVVSVLATCSLYLSTEQVQKDGFWFTVVFEGIEFQRTLSH